MLYARGQLLGFLNHLDWPVLPPDLSSAAKGLNQRNGHLLNVCISLISLTVFWFIPPCKLWYHADAILYIAPLSGRSLLQILPSEIKSEKLCSSSNQTKRSLFPPP